MIDGHVYFAGASNGNIKIGFSVNPTRRMWDLARPHNNTWGHSGIELITTIRGTRSDEAGLHAVFKDFEVAREWFSPLPVKKFLSEVTDTGSMRAYILENRPLPKRSIIIRLSSIEVRRIDRITKDTNDPYAPTQANLLRRGLELALREAERK